MPSCRSAGEAVQGSLTCPNLSGYQCKIILQILLILKNVNAEINCMHTLSKSAVFFDNGLIRFVAGVRASCKGHFILSPNCITKVKFWMFIPPISNYLIEEIDQL